MLPDHNEVHIVTASLSITPDRQQLLWQLLNEEERQRALRFVQAVHQQRFIAAHGILRLLLANYLDLPPTAISYIYNDYQKPALAKPHTDTLQFNFSHSDDRAAYAFTLSGAVGVDIEKIQTDAKIDVAERFFSPKEVAALTAAHPNEQAKIFYRLWSRKEAIIKANGKGLAQSLASFSVGIDDNAESLIAEDSVWFLYPLKLHSDFAAAVATATPAKRLSIWDFINDQPVLKSTIETTS